jgi:abhydrolase domain-containing protein 6
MLIDYLHHRVRKRYRKLGFETRQLTLEHCTLHYFERRNVGSSKTIVLLHGLGTSSSTWVHLLPSFDPSFNIIVPDLPGYGFSVLRGTVGFLSLDELSGEIDALLQTIHAPFLLLGHSLGGWLAARYASEHPDRVSHLILVNNAGILYEGTEEQGRAFLVESIADVRRLLNTLWYRYPWYFKPFSTAILNDLRKRHVAEFVRGVHREDFLNERLARLTMPVSIIWGREDKLISPASVAIMRQAMPHATVHTIEKCGHVPQLERPKEFARAVHQILGTA